MNATALALSVNRLIDKFGNAITYYPPKGNYNDEGDWTPTYETTTYSSRWVESDRMHMDEYTEMGRFHIKDGTMLVKNDINLHIRGKCVSNDIDWEIVSIKPLRVKDVNIIFEVEVKNILP